MNSTVILTAGLAVLIGVSLGLLGGGGSILAVPLLAYVAGLPPQEAIAGSLFVVAVTSMVGLINHARRGHVRWRIGAFFGTASMVGAFAGGLLGGRLPGTVLMVAFALMMVATSAAMLRRRKTQVAGTNGQRHHARWRILLDGLVVGFITGMVGAGGGFLVVPALALLAGLSMPAAVGTSLMVIAMKSVAGLAGYLTVVSLDWGLILMVTVAAVLGALAGSRFTDRVPETRLRQSFGVFVLIMGAMVLALELL
ncbi:sulfite exporter TauE/SafE family protein [Nesterenkonia haasae]|uniref:sulfite exporter TauE/SafE family protein n=1 Tax=Nesterenkonia haasae TaxID=2587813 RepID=UPI001391A347|nr:sulfite exporter TauE/SafE family protein [Nesterenkonia haasae]NDK30275.1 sulfite exporter TauE/SafE family protein [Nesterenkonia haasae]